MLWKTGSLMFLLALLILSFGSMIINRTAAQIPADVTVAEARTMIATTPSLVVLDVRNQSEYDAGHIRNAKLIPVWNLTQNLGELNVNDQILVYCSTGARSANASLILASNGFMNVYNLLEGINGWISDRNSVYINYSSGYSGFSSIQAAIDNATDSQTIYVGAGFYNESLSIDKPLSIVGENANRTIINASNTALMVTAENVSVTDLTVQYTGCACYGYSSVNVTNSRNVNVTDNILTSDDFGIRVVNSAEVSVAYNMITHSGDWAVLASDSQDISVFQNDLTGENGFEVNNSTGSAFGDNNIQSLQTGIFLAESYGDSIFGSNVSYGYRGLTISSSHGNSFFDNSLSGNSLDGTYISQSNNNTIFHNCFFENSGQVLCYDNSTNSWDNGLEGNFWSQYTGVDLDKNGIGDTPEILDSNNRDNYPLMGPLQILNTSLNNDVEVVSNSTIADFEYISSNKTIMLQVSNSTANQTSGFCRMKIPHALVDPFNGSIAIVIDNGETPVPFQNDTVYDDGSNRWIYFAYPMSTHSVSISTIPEFPSSLIMAFFMAAMIFSISNCKKRVRSKKNSRHSSLCAFVWIFP